MEIFVLVSILTVSTIFLVYYLIIKRKFSYWKNQKVPYLEPTSILGNVGEHLLQKTCKGHVYQKVCKQFPKEPYFGLFYGTEPTLVIQDPELIKLVTTKDFYYFSSKEISEYIHKEAFATGLIFTYGSTWRVLRQNLTPLFSSAKMKNMFYLIEKCAFLLEDLLDYETQISTMTEMRSLMGRFTMDCIGACAFGIDTNAMEKDFKNSPFRIIGETIFKTTCWGSYKGSFRAIWPGIFYRLGLQMFPTQLYDFFHKILTNVFRARQYKPSARNDFIDLILKLKENDNYITGDSINNLKSKADEKVRLKIDDELLVGQCLVFFGAGFDTSATTLSYTLFELAKDEDALRCVLEEVDGYLSRHKGKLGYECVNELPYLDACIAEALRLHSVAPVLIREVVEDYILPSGVLLKKGIRVHLPIYHLHHHPDHFPDPEQFRPERFLGDEKKNIKPYTYMPFGEGPRLCIGMRFARMQMFAGLVTILKKYRVELADRMSHTLDYDPKSMLMVPKEGIYLKLIPRDGWEQRVFSPRETEG